METMTSGAESTDRPPGMSEANEEEVGVELEEGELPPEPTTTADEKKHSSIIKYSKEEMVGILFKFELANGNQSYRPEFLSRDFDNKVGLFDPELWLNSVWQKEGFSIPSRGQKQRKEVERLKVEAGDEVVLSPQRRSFGAGCRRPTSPKSARAPLVHSEGASSAQPIQGDGDARRGPSARNTVSASISAGQGKSRSSVPINGSEAKDTRNTSSYGSQQSGLSWRENMGQMPEWRKRGDSGSGVGKAGSGSFQPSFRQGSNNWGNDSRSRNNYNSYGGHRTQDLPEWMDDGPETVHDTIELKGFDDDLVDETGRRSRDGKERKRSGHGRHSPQLQQYFSSAPGPNSNTADPSNAAQNKGRGSRNPSGNRRGPSPPKTQSAHRNDGSAMSDLFGGTQSILDTGGIGDMDYASMFGLSPSQFGSFSLMLTGQNESNSGSNETQQTSRFSKFFGSEPSPPPMLHTIETYKVQDTNNNHGQNEQQRSEERGQGGQDEQSRMILQKLLTGPPEPYNTPDATRQLMQGLMGGNVENGAGGDGRSGPPPPAALSLDEIERRMLQESKAKSNEHNQAPGAAAAPHNRPMPNAPMQPFGDAPGQAMGPGGMHNLFQRQAAKVSEPNRGKPANWQNVKGNPLGDPNQQAHLFEMLRKLEVTQKQPGPDGDSGLGMAPGGNGQSFPHLLPPAGPAPGQIRGNRTPSPTAFLQGMLQNPAVAAAVASKMNNGGALPPSTMTQQQLQNPAFQAQVAAILAHHQQQAAAAAAQQQQQQQGAPNHHAQPGAPGPPRMPHFPGGGQFRPGFPGPTGPRMPPFGPGPDPAMAQQWMQMQMLAAQQQQQHAQAQDIMNQFKQQISPTQAQQQQAHQNYSHNRPHPDKGPSAMFMPTAVMKQMHQKKDGDEDGANDGEEENSQREKPTGPRAIMKQQQQEPVTSQSGENAGTGPQSQEAIARAQQQYLAMMSSMGGMAQSGGAPIHRPPGGGGFHPPPPPFDPRFMASPHGPVNPNLIRGPAMRFPRGFPMPPGSGPPRPLPPPFGPRDPFMGPPHWLRHLRMMGPAAGTPHPGPYPLNHGPKKQLSPIRLPTLNFRPGEMERTQAWQQQQAAMNQMLQAAALRGDGAAVQAIRHRFALLQQQQQQMNFNRHRGPGEAHHHQQQHGNPQQQGFMGHPMMAHMAGQNQGPEAKTGDALEPSNPLSKLFGECQMRAGALPTGVKPISLEELESAERFKTAGMVRE